ncbi:stimulator of interferon genes protein-like [Watersipora subatra]|uniref:stimulator of interferon genes protein-like n=1 Tax=Watersipora subatra TaxID=2589382 RepID=UPI00355AF32C
MAECSDIAVPDLDEGNEYHCFIAFSSKDEQLVIDLQRYLEECKFKVATFHDFGLGGIIVDDIESGVKTSRRIIVIMSQAYLESDWYDHESLVLIHNNSTKRKQLIIPVCYGLSKEEMTWSRLGVYGAQYLNYDPEIPEHKSRIAKALAAKDIPLEATLSCGEVAEGLVWSYYYGYIKLLLPGMVEKCEKWGKEHDKRVIPKLFILIPNTGKCHTSITDCDPNITLEGSTEPVEISRAGVHKRIYKNTVHKIVSSAGEEYYAPCEYATPVLSIYDMCEESIAGLSEEDKLHQIQRFRYLLDRILSHGIVHDVREGYAFKIVFFKADQEGKGEVANQIVDYIKHYQKEKEEEERRSRNRAA